MKQYKSNQKLWKIVKERDTYFYEIRLAGNIIDRIEIDYPVLDYLKQRNLI